MGVTNNVLQGPHWPLSMGVTNNVLQGPHWPLCMGVTNSVRQDGGYRRNLSFFYNCNILDAGFAMPEKSKTTFWLWFRKFQQLQRQPHTNRLVIGDESSMVIAWLRQVPSCHMLIL